MNGKQTEQQDYLFKMLLIGDSGVGKSCLLQQYAENTFNENMNHTTGVDFKIKTIHMNNQNIKLQIWDTAGQERFRPLLACYFKGVQGVIIVYDVTERETYENVRQWMDQIDIFANANTAKVLVGNKCDLEDKRQVSKEEGEELARSNNITYIETSAKSDLYVDDSFTTMVSQIKNNLQMTGKNQHKFFKFEDYRSKITKDLQILGTEDKEFFKKSFLIPEIRKIFKLVGTHSDAFHCDEALATSMLLWTSEFKNSIIVRSRDQELLDQLDLQCDVGAIFDPEKRRFDHHQKTFTHTWWTEHNEAIAAQRNALIEAGNIQGFQALQAEKDQITKLSSAGLIYKFYGKEVIKNICKQEYEKDLTENEITSVYEQIYNGLILEVDAIDNGVDIAEESRYHISTNLSSRVGYLNKPWNCPESAGISQHDQFKKAMKICEEQFIEKIYFLVNIMMPARNIVQQSFEKRMEFHPSGALLWLEQSCPWKEHLYSIEVENDLVDQAKFVFYKDGRGMYRIQAVSAAGTFANRVSIHKDYRGLKGEELNKAADIKDGEFVHNAGFIGGAWSLESSIKMAEESIRHHDKQQKDMEKLIESKKQQAQSINQK